jgi:tetratricopeptide (TPR) repeat protein
MTGRLRAFAIGVVLLGGGAAASASPVIPPGQEQLLGQMLGINEVLADGCKLDTAEVKLSQVEVKYDCAGGARRLVLRHPSSSEPSLAKTAAFAIGDGGGATAALVDAVLSRATPRQAGFRWITPERAKTEPVAPHAPPPGEAPRDPREAELRDRYLKGFELFKERRHEEALAYFLEMARANADYSGVLGMVVANLAPTKLDAAKVAEYVRAAEAAPADPLAQFVAGVAAHYSSHYRAESADEKKDLYRKAIHYLERARPAFDNEPRVFIYLAVSHFRLGQQEQAEAHIEKAVTLDHQDPDAFYCRAEIYQRKDPAKAVADIEKYLELMKLTETQGSPAAPEKTARVRRMADHLRAVQRGEAAPTELWDPLTAGSEGAVAAIASPSPRNLAGVVGVIGALAILSAVAGTLWLRRRKG